MATWLIILVVVASYFLLVGFTGGLSQRLGWSWEQSFLIAVIPVLGTIVVLTCWLWKFTSGENYCQKLIDKGYTQAMNDIKHKAYMLFYRSDKPHGLMDLVKFIDEQLEENDKL